MVDWRADLIELEKEQLPRFPHHPISRACKETSARPPTHLAHLNPLGMGCHVVPRPMAPATRTRPAATLAAPSRSPRCSSARGAISPRADFIVRRTPDPSARDPATLAAMQGHAVSLSLGASWAGSASAPSCCAGNGRRPAIRPRSRTSTARETRELAARPPIFLRDLSRVRLGVSLEK